MGRVLSIQIFLFAISLATFLRWVYSIPVTQESPSATLFSAVNIPDSEMNALYDLYVSTNGQEWKWEPPVTEIDSHTHKNGIPWNFTIEGANPCTDRWQGLNCSFSFPFTSYHIAELVLVDHNLYGTLPQSIGNFSKLHYLNLDKNRLRGTLPESLTDLAGLVILSLSANNFTGPIPKVYEDLNMLRNIYLNNNALSGKIPNIFTGLDQLAVLGLDHNRFSGPLPTSFGSLPSLELLYLNNNHFTGTLSSELCGLLHLQYLRIGNNSFHGPLPACLTNMTALTMLETQSNSFTGAIPRDIGSLRRITYLYLDDNEFTGSIPESIGELHMLQDINLRNNRLTGTIPESIGGLTSLTNMYLYNNYLSGSLPASVNLMHKLIFVYIHHNLLSGALPALTNWTAATSLFVNNNLFRGSLDGVFSSVTQGKITTIQLSDNELTGTLPADIFAIRNLTTFVAVSNCFTGSLPISICDSPSIGTLVLDGLHSAPYCRDTLMPGVTDGYILEDNIKGGIPPCLLSIPTLTTLHLSGNGLTGKLPTEISANSRLLDFSVSHNRLTGTISDQLQQRVWYNFDLSYNRLSGSFVKDFGEFDPNKKTKFFNTTLTVSNVCISLTNNRLSGNIPPRLESVLNISVLDGNLFACNLQQTDLPHSDSGRPTYQCGSNSFNISYYIWLAMVGAFLIAAMLVFWFRSELRDYFALDKMIAYYDKWMHHIEFVPKRDSAYHNSNRDMSMKNYKYLMYVCEGVCKVSAMCTLYIVVVLLPIYAGMSNAYGTHEFEYAWTVSAAFLSGTAATALLLVAFVMLMVVAFILFTIHIRRYVREKEEFFYTAPEEVRRPSRIIADAVNRDSRSSDAVSRESRASDAPGAPHSTQSAPSSSLMMRINVYFLFFLINFVVVLGVNVVYVYVRLYQSSRLLIIAQLALSVFKIIWNSFCSVYIIRWVDHYITEASSDDWKSKESGFFAIQLFVALFNYIAIPCLVVAVISTDCYNNILIESSRVESHYLFYECELFNDVLGCLRSLPQIALTDYDPPFTYSYECSSSLITFYAPTYVYMCFIVTFINPVFEYVAQYVQANAKRGTWYSGQLDYWVPLILQVVSQETEATKLPYDFLNPYLDADLLLVSVVSYLGVLLTFGAVFPPLAACLLVAIFCTTINTKLLVGRFLTNAIDANLHKYVDIIEAECQGAGSIPKLRQCMRLLLVFSFCFYTPFLFDTLGDSVGLQRSFWVIFILPMAAFFGVALKYALKKVFPDFLREPVDNSRRSHSRHQRDVEMSPMSALSTAGVVAAAQGGSNGRHDVLANAVQSSLPLKPVQRTILQQQQRQYDTADAEDSDTSLAPLSSKELSSRQTSGESEATFNILQKGV